MATEEIVNTSLESSRKQATESANRAEGFSRLAQNIPPVTFYGIGRGDLTLYDPEKPGVEVPPFTPDIDLGELMDLAADSNITLFIEKLSTEFTKFVNAYFPDYGVHIPDLEARVQEMLAGDRMLPLPVENALWDRGRSRITKDYLALQQTVSSEFASRGFTLPSGVMTARLDAAKFANHAAAGEFSRDVAIRQAEIAVENLRFAMELAHRHRIDAINACINYVNSIIVAVLDKGIERARLIVDAKRALWDASTTYYNTLVRSGELLLNYEKLMSDLAVERARQMMQALITDGQRYTEGAIGAAQAMAKVAGDALASMNTLASIDHSTVAGE